MARNNPSNPYTRDRGHTKKDVPMPVTKAKVMASYDHPEGNAFHTVRVRVYGDGATYTAPVLAPMFGSVWVPKEGEDVAVIFGESDKPWVIGAWYPLDRVEDGRVDLPDYEAGDIRVGNHTGSHITVHDDGHITIETGEVKDPIDIGFQRASARMDGPQDIDGDENFYKVEFDVFDSNVDYGIFDSENYTMTALTDGHYHINASIGIPDPGQNNRYDLAVFVNGSQNKLSVDQSANNITMTSEVQTHANLEKGDVVDIRVAQNSGNIKEICGKEKTCEFSIDRRGI